MKPEGVHAAHVEYLQCRFKHDSGYVGKRYSPRCAGYKYYLCDSAPCNASGSWGDIRNSREWGRLFPEQPDANVLARLAEFSPREMRRVMFNAFGNAKLAGRDEVEEADIAESRGKQKQRIGF